MPSAWYFFSLTIRFFLVSKSSLKYNFTTLFKNTENYELYMIVLSNQNRNSLSLKNLLKDAIYILFKGHLKKRKKQKS